MLGTYRGRANQLDWVDLGHSPQGSSVAALPVSLAAWMVLLVE